MDLRDLGNPLIRDENFKSLQSTMIFLDWRGRETLQNCLTHILFYSTKKDYSLENIVWGVIVKL